MPSNDRVARAIAAVAPQLAAFRSVVATTLEHARAVLSLDEGASDARLQLGALGARIDPIRFASLTAGGGGLDPVGRERIARAVAALQSLVEMPDAGFVVDVPRGGSLGYAVSVALAKLGRVFGLANAIDLARRGGWVPEQHDRAVNEWPFELWTQRDRKTMPPLVVCVNGADLDAPALVDLLDGNAHIVLVVEGDAALARLVRLITPRCLVVQTKNDQWLSRFTSYSGPAFAALFDVEVATFLHDPDAGRAPWQRVVIGAKPANHPRKRVGLLTPAQQLDELRQLEALAERPNLSAAPIDALAPAGEGDPTERLAAWLLSESGAGPS